MEITTIQAITALAKQNGVIRINAELLQKNLDEKRGFYCVFVNRPFLGGRKRIEIIVPHVGDRNGLIMRYVREGFKAVYITRNASKILDVNVRALRKMEGDNVLCGNEETLGKMVTDAYLQKEIIDFNHSVNPKWWNVEHDGKPVHEDIFKECQGVRPKKRPSKRGFYKTLSANSAQEKLNSKTIKVEIIKI